jgi:hypothetical protein
MSDGEEPPGDIIAPPEDRDRVKDRESRVQIVESELS